MSRNRQRSLFWPILLIGIGVVWLLGNIGLLPDFNFRLLLSLWPLILIVGGLNLLIGRRSPLLSALVALAALGLAIAYVLFAPALGLYRSPEVQHVELAEPIGDTRSLSVGITSSIGRTTLTELNDSGNLFEADMTFLGDLVFEVDGTEEKTIRLGVRNDNFDSSLFNFFDEGELRWDIGLAPDLPLSLTISAGVGEVHLDLSEISLTGLAVDGGVGAFEILLPAPENFYRVSISGGVGDFRVSVADGADLALELDGGVGAFLVDVPDDAAVSLDGQTGVGDISVPSFMEQVRANTQTVGESGRWQTPGYDQAGRQIEITYNGGVGGIRVR